MPADREEPNTGGKIEVGPAPAGSMLLLGAGASVEAGIPDSFGMTEKLVGRIADPWPQATLAHALNYVCGALMAYEAAQGASPYAGLDVERVFGAVELLAGRPTLEVTPFVASWHPAVDAFDRPGLPAFFDRRLSEALLKPQFDRARDEIVSLIEAVTASGSGDNYRRLAERMVKELRTLVAITGKSVGYLSPLARGVRTREALTVATLNYDLGVELMGQEEGVEVDTGIAKWNASRVWEWGRGSLRLLKLHGSIDWSWERPSVGYGHMPENVVVESDDPARDGRQPVLAFGHRGKLRAEGPFLSLLAAFEDQLNAHSHLIAIGYSFRDPHVNDVIRHWLAGSTARTVLIVDPGFDPDRSTGQADFRRELAYELNPQRAAPDLPVRAQTSQLPASDALDRLFPP